MRTPDGVLGKSECPSTAYLREVRLKGHREGVLDIRSQVGNLIVFPLKLPDGNMSTFVT